MSQRKQLVATNMLVAMNASQFVVATTASTINSRAARIMTIRMG